MITTALVGFLFVETSVSTFHFPILWKFGLYTLSSTLHIYYLNELQPSSTILKWRISTIFQIILSEIFSPGSWMPSPSCGILSTQNDLNWFIFVSKGLCCFLLHPQLWLAKLDYASRRQRRFAIGVVFLPFQCCCSISCIDSKKVFSCTYFYVNRDPIYGKGIYCVVTGMLHNGIALYLVSYWNNFLSVCILFHIGCKISTICSFRIYIYCCVVGAFCRFAVVSGAVCTLGALSLRWILKCCMNRLIRQLCTCLILFHYFTKFFLTKIWQELCNWWCEQRHIRIFTWIAQAKYCYVDVARTFEMLF